MCCDVTDIDYGDETSLKALETTTSRLSTVLQPPEFKRLSNISTCGKLNHDETPEKWVGELWFKVGGVFESKCLGTLISNKFLVVPAHCVAALPANITL